MTLTLSLRHQFGGFSLDAQFSAGAGITALFGRSGAGKSTLINAVAGLLRPDHGQIRASGDTLLDTKTGVDVPPHLRRMGLVFQDARLFPHLDVAANLQFGARYATAGSVGPGFDQVVDLLGLDKLLTRAPTSLSGGEKQRVAIGRALLARPRMLLMDEPLANLDAPRKAEILPYLERLRDGPDRLPILYVSHALEEIARLADTLVLMQEGRVALQGPLVEMLGNPDAVPLIGVRDAGAVVGAQVVKHGADGLTTVALSACQMHLPVIDACPGARLRLRIMAHDVILSRDKPDGLSALNILPVRIEEIRDGQGPGAMVALRTGEDRLLARVTTRAVAAMRLEPGMHCHAIVKATSIAPGSIGQIRQPRA